MFIFIYNKVFDSVLNPRKEEDVIQEEVQEEVKEAVNEEPQVEKTEEKPVEHERKTKVVAEEEIPPEERLERPEGAISLAEYREQMKEKNKNILGSSKAQTLNVNLPSDLKVMEKEQLTVKEKKAPKAKKQDNSVQQININFKTEDNSYVSNRNQKHQQNKQPQAKAQIRFEDLPSL